MKSRSVPLFVCLLLTVATTASANAKFKDKFYVSVPSLNQLEVVAMTWNGAKRAKAKRIGTITGIPQPGEIAVGKGRALVISDKKAKSVFVVDTATDTVVGQVKIGKNTRSVAVTEDGNVGFALYGKKNVAVIDLGTAADAPAGRAPSVACTLRGKPGMRDISVRSGELVSVTERNILRGGAEPAAPEYSETDDWCDGPGFGSSPGPPGCTPNPEYFHLFQFDGRDAPSVLGTCTESGESRAFECSSGGCFAFDTGHPCAERHYYEIPACDASFVPALYVTVRSCDTDSPGTYRYTFDGNSEPVSRKYLQTGPLRASTLSNDTTGGSAFFPAFPDDGIKLREYQCDGGACGPGAALHENSCGESNFLTAPRLF
jgi:hypothetical protein